MTDPATIDVNIPRFNQAMVAVFTGFGFVTRNVWVIAAIFVLVAASRFLGPNAALFTQLYVRTVQPRVPRPLETEPEAPPRFSQLLAAVFLALASAGFLAGWPVVGWTITALVFALALLASTTRLCIGCVVYERLAKR